MKKTLSRSTRSCLAVVLGLLASLPAAASELTELDFIGDLPVVLSVTRLAQPLNEVPGSVTILDRETIHRFGARSVPELMKLVPGFLVTHADGNGANPMAVYHGDFGTVYRRMQVFIDGRSVFSSLIAGSINHGLMSVAIDNIERIEVHRGPNSASYGANAFYGVINIVTRHAADSFGKSIVQSIGQNGIHDSVAQVGWGTPDAAYRLSVAQQRDNGFSGKPDSLDLKQANLRGDIKVSPKDDLSFSVGYARHEWDVAGEKTFVQTTSDHTEAWRNFSLQGTWLHQLSDSSQLRLLASHDEEQLINSYLTLKTDGVARRTSVEALYSQSITDRLRAVVGSEIRMEQVISEALFTTSEKLSAELLRVFGNMEWRIIPSWLVNFGGTYEKHNLTGDRFAPRLATNLHVLPDHTLRAVTTTAYRMPTLFELKGDWRSTNPAATVVVKATGVAKPERIDSKEIGYFGEFRDYRATLDIRKFEEQVSDLLGYDAGKAGFPASPNDVVNKPSDYRFRHGWEGQAKWKPTKSTDIWVNHSVVRISTSVPEDALRAPTHFSTLMILQQLPSETEIGLVYTTSGPMAWWGKATNMLPPIRQIDLRLAKRFRVGSTRAEAAIKFVGVNGAHAEYTPKYTFDRRAFATLRLDF